MSEMTVGACCCIGRQDNEPFCPCEMRMRGIFKRGNEWIEPEKVVGKAIPSNFDENLSQAMLKHQLNESYENIDRNDEQE